MKVEGLLGESPNYPDVFKIKDFLHCHFERTDIDEGAYNQWLIIDYTTIGTQNSIPSKFFHLIAEKFNKLKHQSFTVKAQAS